MIVDKATTVYSLLFTLSLIRSLHESCLNLLLTGSNATVLYHPTLYPLPNSTMSSLVQAYEKLLLDNVSTVRSVESGLRNLTWLLPGRFADAEVASEGR
jgi:hypothetical protein